MSSPSDAGIRSVHPLPRVLFFWVGDWRVHGISSGDGRLMDMVLTAATLRMT